MKGWIKNKLHFVGAIAAIIYFGYPARKIRVIGVTGTDGKTTTATLIYNILKTARKKVALITTVAAYIGRRKIDTGFHVTTPNPWHLQKLIKEAVQSGCEYLVLEVTSHGLDQHRVLGTNISIAVVTNVSWEHLDYHKTFSNYLKTKAKIFKGVRIAVLNKIDPSYKKLKRMLKPGTRLISYDLDSNNGKLKRAVELRFSEKYNWLNASASISVARALQIEEKAIMEGIKTFPQVPGRMEFIKNNKGIKIIIDFAHTPNALKNVLMVLKSNLKNKSRLIAVFGCAGERDKAKRPMMGAISTRFADISVYTSEDPRHENVDDIINAMAKGAKKTGVLEVKPEKGTVFTDYSKKPVFLRISDRGEAIAFAINDIAKRGDTIVICGKGHEKSMAYNGIEYPWSDKKAVRLALNNKTLKTRKVNEK